MKQFVNHPFHNVDPAWNGNLINAIVEIPLGSRIKYEVDKESGLIKMDRILTSSFEYPANYGFIPRTLGEDGDPLDILVITRFSLTPLCLVRCRILGLMRMIDRNIQDDKILAVPEMDSTQSHLNKLDDLPEHFFKELNQFFEEYTKLENKKVDVKGFESAEETNLVIDLHLKRYKEKIKF